MRFRLYGGAVILPHPTQLTACRALSAPGRAVRAPRPPSHHGKGVCSPKHGRVPVVYRCNHMPAISGTWPTPRCDAKSDARPTPLGCSSLFPTAGPSALRSGSWATIQATVKGMRRGITPSFHPDCRLSSHLKGDAMPQLNQIKAQVLSTIVAAVLLASLAAVGQLVTDGGLVSVLGGATKSDLESVSPVPVGAVIAFDRPNGCPKGWSDFAVGQSRMIVGATFKESLPNDENRLSAYKYRQTGGREQHTLRIEEMPRHTHEVNDPGHSHRVSGGFSAKDRDNQPGGGELTNGSLARGNHYSQKSPTSLSIKHRGDGKPHSIMPPHIALYFCKRD